MGGGRNGVVDTARAPARIAGMKNDRTSHLLARPAAVAIAILAILLGGRAARADGPAPTTASAAPAATTVADVTLPWNPLDGAVAGDWARYKLTDPGSAGEQQPPEIFSVRSIEGDRIAIDDVSHNSHSYVRGEGGKSALAYVRGFFGKDGETEVASITRLAVTLDPVEVGGARYDAAVRLDVTLFEKLGEDEGGSLSIELHIRLAPGVKAGGLVKATADARRGDEKTGGLIELAAQGKADENPMPESKPAGEAPRTPTGAAMPSTPPDAPPVAPK